MRLGVDPRRADQIVRGSISLPAGSGRTARVAVFAAGEPAAEARAAGADFVGADDLVARIEKEGFLEFDVAIATPDLMAQVGRLGRILGPRGLMPNPKTGTVTTDVAKAVAEFKAGRVEYRTDRVGNVHVPIGKVSFERAALLDNYRAVLDELIRAKPAAAKGRYLRSLDPELDDGTGREDRSGESSNHRRGAGCLCLSRWASACASRPDLVRAGLRLLCEQARPRARRPSPADGSPPGSATLRSHN